MGQMVKQQVCPALGVLHLARPSRPRFPALAPRHTGAEQALSTGGRVQPGPSSPIGGERTCSWGPLAQLSFLSLEASSAAATLGSHGESLPGSQCRQPCQKSTPALGREASSCEMVANPVPCQQITPVAASRHRGKQQWPGGQVTRKPICVSPRLFC